ncbi:MAG: hypothetical protein AB7T49_09245 [Oligoflexales bacterium]
MAVENKINSLNIRWISYLTLTLVLISCGTGNNRFNNDLDETWADFPVELLRPEESFHILLQSYTPVQEIDTSSTFNLFGIRTSDALFTSRFNVFYVDNFSGPSSVESATVSPEFVVNKQEKIVDVYFRLHKRSPSYSSLTTEDLTVEEIPSASDAPAPSDDTRIFIGRAKFEADTYYAKVYLPKKMRSRVSIISARDYPGHSQLALHYITNPLYSMEVPLTSCLEGDGSDCRIITVEGACAGDIMACVPRAPAATPSQDLMADLNAQNGLQYLGKGVFVFNKAEIPSYTLDFKIAFPGEVKGDPEDVCEEQLRIIKQTPLGGRDNTLCHVTKKTGANDEAEVTSDGLTCALQIEFISPLDVADYFCEIDAKLEGETPRVEKIQFIYKD